MDRPGAAQIRQELEAANAAYVAAGNVLHSGALMHHDGEAPFGHFFILEAATRTEADRWIAAHPFHAAGLWRQTLVRRIRWDESLRAKRGNPAPPAGI